MIDTPKNPRKKNPGATLDQTLRWLALPRYSDEPFPMTADEQPADPTTTDEERN